MFSQQFLSPFDCANYRWKRGECCPFFRHNVLMPLDCANRGLNARGNGKFVEVTRLYRYWG